ncbi:MAG: DNA mismatch repair endonuclease MutL, partial [Firmicutes bacterium]|nr:DNA mismatch repair endonuclease MutL [Bacillota bacterium]
MTGIIKALPKEIADKIAAGEVVERPLSIVKELVENSVDAGARSITVEIRKGGKEYIRVSDDGKGIAPDQVELAFRRYATSKIESAEDLDRIQSLGFRGEALASIAAVCRVELTTKTHGARIGSRIVVTGGITEEKGDTACQEGTTIVVRDLFFNTPARRKFLKADNAESSLITDFISKMAIAYPGIRIRLINNGTILFSTMGKGDLKQAILTVYSPQLIKKLLPVNGSDGQYSVRAYISAPSESRTNRRYQIFFVNGRLVKSRMLEQAVSQAYSDKLFDGRYPCAFLFLQLPPESLDVNIHPTKTEIRFFEEETVKEFLINALRRALLDPQASELSEQDVRIHTPRQQAPQGVTMPLPQKTQEQKLEPSAALKQLFKKAETKESAAPAEEEA